MKHSLKSNLAVIFMMLSMSVFSQKKTILIPPDVKLKNGENFACIVDDISFYTLVVNGKKEKLIAKDKKGKTLDVDFHTTYEKDDNDGLVTVCEACVQVMDEQSGQATIKCYEVKCEDVEDLRSSSIKPIWINFSTSQKTPIGKVTLYKDANFIVKGTYNGKYISEYEVANLKKERLSIEFETGQIAGNNTARETVKCYIKVHRRLPDGTVITTRRVIPCGNLPSPKNPPATQ